MQIRASQPSDPLTPSSPARVDDGHGAPADDIAFLAAWEQGLVPWLAAFLRVRQIRRANLSQTAG